MSVNMRKSSTLALAAASLLLAAAAAVPARADTVTVTTGGAPLAGATVASPVQVDVAGTGISSVKFLLDGAYLGTDSAPPFSWPVTASVGAHTLKVRPVVNGAEQRLEAAFTVPATPQPTPPPTLTPTGPADVYVTPADDLRPILATAAPGTTIHLADGEYLYKPRLVASAEGTAAAPITLVGSRAAVLRSSDSHGDYGLEVQGDFWRVVGLTVAHASKGIVLDGSTGTVLDGVEVADIGAEGIHVRANSRDAVVRDSWVHGTGRDKPQYGEGVYVGSASGNWSASYVKAVTGETVSYGQDGGGQDRSDGALIENNRIENTNAEGADLKEGTSSGTLRNNTFINAGISGQNSADSAVDVKGNGWVVTGNQVVLTASTWTDEDGAHPVVFEDAMQTHTVYAGYGQGNLFSGNSFAGTVDGYLVQVTNTTATVAPSGNSVACGQDWGGAQLGLTNIGCS